MVKRHTITFVAVCLVTIFIAEAANALIFRSRRSVENFHNCTEVTDPCYGATSVTDRLYGWDGTKAICEMTGRLFCTPENNDEICSDSDAPAPLYQASFSETATFDVATAENLTVLNDEVGQDACDSYYDGRSTDFEKFWPNQFLAHTVYTFDDDRPDYELIETCEIVTDDPQYACEEVWNSTSTAPHPHLPCCGESNTLTVNVSKGGTVTSDYNGTTIIDCGPDNIGDCDETFDGTSTSIDACPELLLTATPEASEIALYTFAGWSGGCSGLDPECTVFPPAVVAATFEADSYLLKVTLNNIDKNDRVRIFEPSNLIFEETGDNICDKAECTVWVDPDITVVIKKQGDSIMWDGDCSGVANDNLNCALFMDGPKEAIVEFGD
jgi:hypothetical protein